MAYSKVSICNLALAILGVDEIRSLDEENTRADLASRMYDSTVNRELSAFDWGFARSIAKLNETGDTLDVPVGTVAYVKPSDCLRPRDILPAGSRNWWKEFGKYILVKSGYDSVYLLYTKSGASVALFSEAFVNVLQYAMAMQMCVPLTQNLKFRRELAEELNLIKAEAYAVEANTDNDYPGYDGDPLNDTFANPDAALNAIGTYNPDVAE